MKKNSAIVLVLLMVWIAVIIFICFAISIGKYDEAGKALVSIAIPSFILAWLGLERNKDV